MEAEKLRMKHRIGPFLMAGVILFALVSPRAGEFSALLLSSFEYTCPFCPRTSTEPEETLLINGDIILLTEN